MSADLTEGWRCTSIWAEVVDDQLLAGKNTDMCQFNFHVSLYSFASS